MTTPTTIIYPQIFPQIRKIKPTKSTQGRTTIFLSTWVRISRGTDRYLILSNWHGELGYDASPDDIFKIINTFLSTCERIKYLWVEPPLEAIADMIEKGVLKYDSFPDFTDKELFLFNFRF